MEFEILESGHLRITLDDDGRDDLNMDLDGDRYVSMAELLDTHGLSGNGMLYEISPEDVGALTDSPILCDDVDYEDDGSVNARGNVWWFPDYAITCPVVELAESGVVTFTSAPENT